MPLDQDYLRKPFRKLRKKLKAFPKQPRPELVHQVRTSSRRIEAVTAALALDSRKDVRRLLRRMRRVRKQAGKVRDLDVLTGFAAQVPADQERECSIRLLESLGAERVKKAARMRQVVRRETPALSKILRRCSQHVDRFLADDAEQTEASSRVAAAVLQHSDQLQNPARLNRGNLHPFRLQVKRLQYVLQMAENRSAEQQQFLDNLKEVKDAIGEWHDWQELLSFAGKVLTDDRNCQLLREIKSTADHKFERALQIANEMRSRYLTFQHSAKRGRRRLPQPLMAAEAAVAA